MKLSINRFGLPPYNGGTRNNKSHWIKTSACLALHCTTVQRVKKPLSEKQAAAYLEKNYAEMGREKAKAEQRKDIYQKLGIMK